MAVCVPAYVQDAALVAQLEHEVALEGASLLRVDDPVALRDAMRRPDSWALLVDAGMPDVDVLGLLQEKSAEGIKAEFVILHGDRDTDFVNEAFSLGAFECIPRNGDPRVIAAALKLAVARMERERLLMDAHEQLERTRQRQETIARDIKRRLLQDESKIHCDGYRAGLASAQASRGDVDLIGALSLSEHSLDCVLGTVRMLGGTDAALAAASLKQDYFRLVAGWSSQSVDGLPDLRRVLDDLATSARWVEYAADAQPELTLVRFCSESGRLHLVSSGSPSVVLFSADSRRARSLSLRETTTEREELLKTQEVVLEPGDVVVVCSCGVAGAQSRQAPSFGEERLREAVVRHADSVPWEMADGVIEEAAQHCGGMRFARADMACVAFDLQPVRAGDGRVLVLQRRLKELRRVRAFCRDLAGHVLDVDAIQRLVLAADETMSNIVRHAGSEYAGDSVEVHGRRDGESVEIEFCYRGPSFLPTESPSLPDAEDYPEGGFGLYIINQSADSVCYERADDGRNCVRLSVRSGREA